MSSTSHAAPAPLGGPLVTPVTITLALLTAIAAVILCYRLVFGLGAVSNISDGYPWGVWLVYDVMIGSAFACGGYIMAILVYIFNRGEYHPMVRPALLASVFGYTLAGVSVVIDLSRWWNAWHIMWPTYVQTNSVLCEVAICISAYTMVAWIELTPAFLKKFGFKDLNRKLNKVMFLILALGVLLPTMHQSSLGSLLIVFGNHVHPLWQTLAMPLLFLISCMCMGFAIVIFESCLASSGFHRPLELHLLGKLSKLMVTMVSVFLLVRVADLAWRGVLGYVFEPTLIALMFWIETALFAAPLVLLCRPAERRKPSKLFVGAVCLMLGGFILRINAYLIGYSNNPGWHYFPSISEILVSIGFISFEIMAYIVLVRYLPILPKEKMTIPQ
jgi:Ni/Fe-hydrogenase subunit HybB-like protein